MSGLTIDHGGVVAVDTGRLRDVTLRLRAVEEAYAAARAALERAAQVLGATPWADPWTACLAVRRSVDAVAGLQAQAQEGSAGAALMADAYEVVELRVQAEALARTDAAAAATLFARLDRLLAADERVAPLVHTLEEQWRDRRFAGLGDRFDALGVVPPVFLVGAMTGLVSGLGTVRPGAALRGAGDAVRVTAVGAASAVPAPAGVAQALRRLPSTAGAQVAVERYTMPDGAVRYLAYLDGTRSMSVTDPAAPEPWDGRSDVQLYTGETSASYRATVEALRAAGAEPGDRVDVVGYSQSGMIAAHLSMESDFEVGMQLTAGSPVQPTLDAGQTLVQLRHSDDPVSALAAGGSAEGTGSPDSFTATRESDPGGGPREMALTAHAIDAYLETAEQVDASSDPRAEALRAYWAELDTAVSIERTEYRAERRG